MNKYFYIALFLIVVGKLNAQNNIQFLFTDAEKYRPSKYANYLGEPYLYAVWVVGKVFTQAGEVYYPMLINYNSINHQWEARYEGKAISLDPYFFWYVEIERSDNPIQFGEQSGTIKFIRGVVPDDELDYGEMIYNGKRIKLIKSYDCRRDKIPVEDGDGRSMVRFFHKHKYHLSVDNKFYRIDLDQDEIIDKLKSQSEIISFIDKENIDLNTENDWNVFLAKVEELFY